MRTGIPTLHQALTPEAATILKLSLSLAQRRNHAQVTPLHVATTLLTTSTSPSLCTPTNLLKRACLKSQQQPNYQNTLLHCRALELCFNVALNRLPTCTSPSSSSSTTNCATTNPNTNSLMHASYPTLSNALVAALKRAQANQRRGCIELQQQQSQLQQNQLQQNQGQNQNQPLLAIKVELEQLIISILDDPSVSRVMREAGFSSSLVKSSLEEEREKECSVLGLGQNKDLWQSQLIKPIFDQDPLGNKSQKEDVRLIFHVMGRKMQDRKRNNPVLVGDSVSLTESLVEEVRRRLERGDVPEELRRVQFVNFGISTYMQLGLAGKGGLEAKVEELKRNLVSSNGVVIYIGDLKWALADETMVELDSGFNPIRYIVEGIEKLVCGSNGGKLWVLGISSYQTYMQVKRSRPSLEVKWGLHAVTVPSGGLSLSLQAPAQRLEPRVTSLNQSSYQLFEVQQKAYFAPKEEGEEEREVLCFECNANYEREASIILSSDSRSTGGIQLPSWLRPNRPISHHKVNLVELRSKWSRLCQKLHQYRTNNSQFYPSLLSSNFCPKNLNLINPIWGSSNQNKPMFELHSAPFQTNCPKTWPLEVSRDKEIMSTNSATNLFLGGLFNLSDSATSEIKEKRKRGSVEVQELEKRLYENIPWQSGAIASIVEAFEKKENLILLEGDDHIAKRRVALIIAETYCGSGDKLLCVDPTKVDIEIISKEVKKEKSSVVLIEDINQAPADVVISLASLKDQSDAIIILTVSQTDAMLKKRCKVGSHGVVKMKFLVEMPSDNDHKRKSPDSESELEKEPKRQRGETGLDLNLSASEDEEEAIPSDITHEGDGFDRKDLPQSLFQKIGACIVIGGGSDSFVQISNRILTRLNCACSENRDEDGHFGSLCVDKEVVEWLVWASGCCLESLFEKWIREVFQTCVPTVKKGGKLRLKLDVGAIEGGIEGSEGIVPGFCGSVLPEKIYLD